jgi:DNA gyrase subunit B
MSIDPAELSMPEPRYTADDIVVLSGLEAVRKRPGMYVGDMRDGSGLHQMVYEVVGNALESLGGDEGRVTVTLNADGSVTVEDNGHGMPVNTDPREGIPAAEMVMTRLYSGGVYGRKPRNALTGVGAATGVGVVVVNALASRLDLTIWRGGREYAIAFEKGVPLAPLTVIGDAHGRTGTRITFLPVIDIFTSTMFDYETLKQRLREVALFHAGLAIVLTDARGAEPVSEEVSYPGGLKDYVRTLEGGRAFLPREPVEACAAFDDITVEGAFSWRADGESDARVYTNCDRQKDGGTHLAGFLDALTQVFGERAVRAGIASPAIIDNDVRMGLNAIVCVTMGDPRYEGSPKDKLASPEVRPAVRNAVIDALNTWFETRPNDAKAILQKIIATARKREAGEHLARALQNIV